MDRPQEAAVTLSISSADAVITDADGNVLSTVGNAVTFYVTPTAEGTGTIGAQVTATLGPTQVGSETPITITLPLPVTTTTTTDVGSEGRVLPRTGSESSGLLLIAAGLALIGSSLVLRVRRARP